MLEIQALVRKVSVTNATVLVRGESGTGKELVAQAIHAHSLRAGQPLVPVNCGAIPAELLESELFGHQRGAFTGAIASHAGMFRNADGGTLFLDEIGEMSPALQVKLLRVLQDGEIRPVGSDRSTTVNVRIIAATSRDLATAMKENAFREDLFYRLSVIPIVIPPLRERRSDIPMLIGHFLAKHNRKRLQHDPVEFNAEVVGLLGAYDWPGNVRELENVVERMVVLSEETVLVVDSVPSNVRHFVAVERMPKVALWEQIDFDGAIELYGNRLIDAALDRAHGNKQQAAHILGLKRTTLLAKLQRRTIGASVEARPKWLLS